MSIVKNQRKQKKLKFIKYATYKKLIQELHSA